MLKPNIKFKNGQRAQTISIKGYITGDHVESALYRLAYLADKKTITIKDFSVKEISDAAKHVWMTEYVTGETWEAGNIDEELAANCREIARIRFPNFYIKG